MPSLYENIKIDVDFKNMNVYINIPPKKKREEPSAFRLWLN